MPDIRRSLDYFLNASTGVFKSANNITAQMVRDFALGVMFPQQYCQGRLTTESGVAVSTSDRSAQNTLYFTPYNGNLLGLFDGTSWKPHILTEQSLALSGLTSGKNYDVFIYDNAGTLTLELSAAWTNDTTRSDALTIQDAIFVKSGATTRRYLGTIRSTSTTATEDSQAKRFVWNAYNQVYRSMRVIDTTDSWTYTTNTVRYANNTASNRLEFVCGLPTYAEANILGMVTNDLNAAGYAVGIGVDSATTMSPIRASVYGHSSVAYLTVACTAQWNGTLDAGWHFLAWLELCTTGTPRALGDGASTQLQSGIWGKIQC